MTLTPVHSSAAVNAIAIGAESFPKAGADGDVMDMLAADCRTDAMAPRKLTAAIGFFDPSGLRRALVVRLGNVHPHS